MPFIILIRAEIREIALLYFRRIEDTTISFWNFLTFTKLVWKIQVHENDGSATISAHCAQFPTNGFETLLEFQGLLENPKVMSHLKKVHSKLEREKK